jgi:BRO family, N-terminal domain
MDKAGFKRLEAHFVRNTGATRAFNLEMCRFAMTEAKRTEFNARSIEWFDAEVAPRLTGAAPPPVVPAVIEPIRDSPSGSTIGIPNFDEKIRRCVGPDGKFPWFNVKDVVKELGYRVQQTILDKLTPEERGYGVFLTPGGPQSMAIVSRPGLLKVCQDSDKAKAKEVDYWIRHVIMGFR